MSDCRKDNKGRKLRSGESQRSDGRYTYKYNILEFVRTDKHFSQYYDGIFLLFKTGLRISELCGLTVHNIDLEKRRFTVDHQLQRSREIILMELIIP